MDVMSSSFRKGGKSSLYMNVCNLPMICKSEMAVEKLVRFI